MRIIERLAALRETEEAVSDAIGAVDGLAKEDRTMTIEDMRTHMISGRLMLENRTSRLKGGREDEHRRSLS